MDSEFEQQFMQNVKTTQPVQPQKAPGQPKPPRGNTSITPFIIAIVALGFALLLESVVLVFFAVDYFKVQAGNADDLVNEGTDEPEGDGKYAYNSNYNVTAINVKCIAEDGSVYTFNFERKFQLSSGTSGAIDSGTYSVINDSVLTLNNGSKAVYFDGDFIADGTKMYDCGV